jgi:UDPglucose 6-dehydrogenase
MTALIDRVSVVGLGKLGSPLAAVLASKGFSVIGVDTDTNAISIINKGMAPVQEPALDALIKQVKARLTATNDYYEAVTNTDITFIIVPTPSDKHGSFSLRHVLAAAEAIGQAIRYKQDFHLIVLTSIRVNPVVRGLAYAIAPSSSH